MKKAAAFLLGCLMLSCFHNSPLEPNSLQKKEVQYGSCVVKLPQLTQLALAKRSGKDIITYKFLLTISGDGMETMSFSWTLDGNSETYTIDKIPAGKSRYFKGVLYGTNGITYEDSTYADIYGGQVAYVNLVLKKTGSAQLEVIIEDDESSSVTICYNVHGYIYNKSLDGLILRLEIAPPTEYTYGYFYNGNSVIGKFYGKIEKEILSGEFSIEFSDNRVGGYIKADIYPYLDYSYFKGVVFNDTTQAGNMYGEKTTCDIIIPPPKEECSWDTILSDTCLWKEHWIALGKKSCAERGLSLNRYSFSTIHECGDTDYCDVFCFECCKANVTPPPSTQKCYWDTLGGFGSTSCKDTATWIKYAREACKEKNLFLGSYNFLNPCGKKKDSNIFYETICFECCTDYVTNYNYKK